MFLAIINFCHSQDVFQTYGFDIKSNIEKQILLSFDTLLFQSKDSISNKWSNYTIKKFGNGFDNEMIWSLKHPDIFRITILLLTRLESENMYLLKYSITMNSDSINNSVKIIHNIVANNDKINKKIFFSKFSEYFTSDWYKTTVGEIEYVKKIKEDFNFEEAKEQSLFNKKIAHIFKSTPKKVLYFSCVNAIDIFNTLGFDYIEQMYYAKKGGLYKYGGTLNPNIIYSGNNQEIYEHEFVHIYTNEYLTKNTTRLANEGVATYFGGSNGISYKDYTFETLNKIKADKKVEINDLLFVNKKYEDETSPKKYSTIYCMGAIIAEKLYKKQGIDGLIKFLNTPKNKMIQFLGLEFGIQEDKLQNYLTK